MLLSLSQELRQSRWTESENLRLAHCGTVPTIISSSTGGTENHKPFGPIGELKTGRKGNYFLFFVYVMQNFLGT